MKRAIHVVPDTSKAPWIETLRQQFDPLYDKIKAHLTLVFPFELPVSDADLIHHCHQAAGGIAPFSITLTGFHRSPDEHFWLTVGPSEPLSILTQNLHIGPLGTPATARRSDSHHLTIARPPLPPSILTEVRTHERHLPVTLQIISFILERILPDQSSLELGTFHLRQFPGKGQPHVAANPD